MTSFATIERNGLILVWYHAEGVEPIWEPPEIEQISSGQWTWRGRTEHIINAHIEVLIRPTTLFQLVLISEAFQNKSLLTC